MSAVASDRWLWTAPLYFQAVETGLIDADERLELIERELIRMPPIGPRHADTVDELVMLVTRQLDHNQ